MDKRFGTTARKEKDIPLNISEKGGAGITAQAKIQAKGKCKKCGGKLGWFIHDDTDAVWWGRILVLLAGGYANGTVGYRICKSCVEKDHYQNEPDKKLVMLILAAAWVLNVFLWIKVETSFLKIILMIVFSLLLLINSFTKVFNFFSTTCPFHNDPRMLDAGNLSYEAVYKDREDNDFCSVFDSIRNSQESACKNDTFGCFSGGKGCPFFEKYKTLSESELRDFYVNKVKNG
jgi:uncharacterized protein (DUF983 family)